MDPPESQYTPVPDASTLGSQSELLTTWALLILIVLLLAIVLISYLLQRNQIRFIHETVVSLILGLVVGLFIKLSSFEGLQEIVSFDHRYFFNLLLPPIILNSGYDMKRERFFRNFGSILTFAFLGTFISTLVIGIMIYLVALTGIHALGLSLLDCLVFGAILSSTDPVTVLAIFHQRRVDPQLYAIIFGESLLNDSVAIALFTTLSNFNSDSAFSLSSIFYGIGSFSALFFGSLMIGVIMALICTLMLKHSQLFEYPSLESCMVLLLAYASYLLSNGCHLSGIVSLLFCGITLKHYAYDNLSLRSRRTTKYMFRVLSQMSENFVFIYLGISIFTRSDSIFLPVLIVLILIILLVARYISTVPLAWLVNSVTYRLYGKVNHLPKNHQWMMWWAGLRGAIAFALAFEVTGKAGDIIRSTTLVVCVISVLILGGTTNYALERLKIETDVGPKRNHALADDIDDATDSSVDGFEDDDDDSGYRYEYEDEHPLASFAPRSSVSSYASSQPLSDGPPIATERSAPHWFINFDDQWVKPLFSRRKYERPGSSEAYPRSRGPPGTGSSHKRRVSGSLDE